MSIRLEIMVDFFGSFEMPNEPIKTTDGVITDPKKFIKSHISFLQANNNNRTFIPYYDRLLEVYKIYNDDKLQTNSTRLSS